MKRSYETSNINTNSCKIVLIGNSCTGKSTFFNKICNLHNSSYQFPKKYNATDNFDFNRIIINTSKGSNTIDIWDTAGQENRGGKLRDAYLKGADGILLLYDLSDSTTSSSIPTWLEQIKKVTPNIPVAVLGNKADKFDTMQQTNIVKLRECNLQKDVGHLKIKSFLISIKEDIHLDFTTTKSVEKAGCMIGLEYLLSSIYNTPITVNY
jgi:small GTP-binding protein